MSLLNRTTTPVALAAVIAAAGWSQGEPGQDKSTPTSKVERLNRAPVSKEILNVKLPRPVETVLPNGIHCNDSRGSPLPARHRAIRHRRRRPSL